MQALRIEAEGLTTSFRYPHFLVGRQPTFRMPPPATIYGHVCSAVGDVIDTAGLQFAYIFGCDGIGDDLESLHISVIGSGELPGPSNYPRNLAATPTPTRREVLLYPRLTLYLAAESGRLSRLLDAFREPRYVVTLGRSQDLMAYRSVELIDLEEAEAAYFEGTLLPWSYRPHTLDGIGVIMPRFIDPENRRQVTWSPFVMLEGPVRTGTIAEAPRRRILTPSRPDERWWIDPTAPTFQSLPRGIIWQRFVGDEPGDITFINPPTASVG